MNEIVIILLPAPRLTTGFFEDKGQAIALGTLMNREDFEALIPRISPKV